MTSTNLIRITRVTHLVTNIGDSFTICGRAKTVKMRVSRSYSSITCKRCLCQEKKGVSND